MLCLVTLLSISKHSPENCPFYSEKLRKIGNEMIEKYGSLDKMGEEREKIVKKHGIKEIGTWIVPSEHIIFMVREAPSIEAYQKFLIELQSPMLKVSTTEIKMAVSSEDALKMMIPFKDRISEDEWHILRKIIEHFL